METKTVIPTLKKGYNYNKSLIEDLEKTVIDYMSEKEYKLRFYTRIGEDCLECCVSPYLVQFNKTEAYSILKYIEKNYGVFDSISWQDNSIRGVYDL